MSAATLRRLIVIGLIALVGNPAARRPNPRAVPALAVLDARRRLERGGRIRPRARRDALRGRDLDGVCLRRRHPVRRHRRQPAAAAHPDHADGLEPLCGAAGHPLSGLHGVARHRLGIQDRVRLHLWLPADDAGHRRRDPDHRSATAARRAQHGRDAEPAAGSRHHPRGNPDRAVRPARRRRARDRRRGRVGNADLFRRHRLSDLALPHHSRQPACVRRRAAGAGDGDCLQRRDQMDRAQGRRSGRPARAPGRTPRKRSAPAPCSLRPDGGLACST